MSDMSDTARFIMTAELSETICFADCMFHVYSIQINLDLNIRKKTDFFILIHRIQYSFICVHNGKHKV